MGRDFCLAGLLIVASAAFAQSGERTLALAPKQPIAGEPRHALVIGNDAYGNGPLRNPVNDARAMAKALGEAGFNVVLVENGTQLGMHRAIRNFGNHIAKGGVGLFYYAGHGLQVKGRNYLVPVNAEISVEDEIEFTTVDINVVLAKMDSAKNSLNIVILDACRNNPFAKGFRSVQTGLAQMDAPTGTFIAFATAPGSLAADGMGDNGVYTKHLLVEMARPGVPIELMFKQVRNGVMTETKGRQIPWESSSMRGEFSFRPGAASPAVEAAVAEALRRERESQKGEIDKILREALERQRQQLEALGLQLPVPDTKKVPATTGLAIVTSPVNRRMPAMGDTWTYRLVETKGSNRGERRYAVTVAAVTIAGIMERYSLEGSRGGQWVHDSRASLVNLGASVFSPYLHLTGPLPIPGRIDRIQIQDTGCTGEYICDATGAVSGRETITTAAGTFETTRVVIEQSWRASQPQAYLGSQLAGGRLLTIWYSADAKRAVKFSSRLTYGGVPPIEANFDLELASYKVQ